MRLNAARRIQATPALPDRPGRESHGRADPPLVDAGPACSVTVVLGAQRGWPNSGTAGRLRGANHRGH